MAEMRIPDADRVGIASSSLSIDTPRLGGLTTPQKKTASPAAAKPGSSVPKRWSSMQGTPDYIADLAGRTGYLPEEDSRYWASQFSAAAGYKDDTPENAQRKIGIYEKLVRAIAKDSQQGYMPRELAQNLISSAALAAGEIRRAQAGRAEAERLGPLGQAKEAALFQLQDISRENIAPTITSGIAAETMRGRRVPAREVLETTAGKIGAGAAGIAAPIAEIIAASAIPTAAIGMTPLAPAAPVLGPLIGAGIQAAGGQASRGIAQRARLGRAQERVRQLSQELLKNPGDQDTQNQLYEAIAVAEEASKGVTPVTEAAKQILASVGSAFVGSGAIRGLTAGVRAITPARIASQIRPSVRAAFNPAAESTVGSVAGTLAQTGIAEGRFATPEELGFGLGVGGALGAASVRSAAKGARLVDNLANALRSNDTATVDAAMAALDKANIRGKQRQRIVDAATAKAQTPPPAPAAAAPQAQPAAAPQAAPAAPQPTQQVWTGAALLDPNRGPVAAGDRVSLPSAADPTQMVGGEVVFVEPGENFMNIRLDSGEVLKIPARSTSVVSQPESILGAARPVGPQPTVPAVKFGDVKAGTAQPKLGENMEIMLDGNRVEAWRVVGMDVDGGYTLERGGRRVRLDANAADPTNVTGALQEEGVPTAAPGAAAAQAPSSLQPVDVAAAKNIVAQGGGYFEYVDAKNRRNIVYLSAYDPATDKFTGHYAQDPGAELRISSNDLAKTQQLSRYNPYEAEIAALSAATTPQEIDAALGALDQKSRTEIASAASRSAYIEKQARGVADAVMAAAVKANPEIQVGVVRRGLLKSDEDFVKEFDPTELPATLPTDLATRIGQKYQQGVETLAQLWVNAANDPRVALMPDQVQKDALIARLRAELLDSIGKAKSPARASVEARIAQLAPSQAAPARAGRAAAAPTAARAAAPEPAAVSDEARAYLDAEARGDTAEASRIYNASQNPDALSAEVRRARTAPVAAPAPAAPAPKPAAPAPKPAAPEAPVTTGSADLVAQISPAERKLFIRMMSAAASNKAREKADYDAFLTAQQQDPKLAERFDAFLELSEVDDNLLKVPQNVQEAPIPGYVPAAPAPAPAAPAAPPAAPVETAPKPAAPAESAPAAAPVEPVRVEEPAPPAAETVPTEPSPETIYTVGKRRYRVLSRRSDKWEVEAVTPTGKAGARSTVDANSGIAQQIKMAEAKAEPTDTRVYDIPTRGGVKRYQVLNEDGDKWLVQEFDAQGQPVKGPTTMSADSPYAGIIRSERNSAEAAKSVEPETVAKRLATLYRQALKTENNEKALADIEKQAADAGVEMGAVVAAAEAQGPLPVARPYKDVSPEDLVRRITKADKEWEDTSKEPSLARRESMKRGIESRRRAMEKELQTRGPEAMQALKAARDADVARLKQAEEAAKKAAASAARPTAAPAARPAAAPTVQATVSPTKASPVTVVQPGKANIEETLIEKLATAIKNSDSAAVETINKLIENARLNADKIYAKAAQRAQSGKPAAPKAAPKAEPKAAPKLKGAEKAVEKLKGKDPNLARVQELAERFGFENTERWNPRKDMSEDELAELANLLQNPTAGLQAVLKQRGPKWLAERLKMIQDEASERGAAREARFRDAVAEFEQARKVVAETPAEVVPTPEVEAPIKATPAPEVEVPATKPETTVPSDTPVEESYTGKSYGGGMLGTEVEAKYPGYKVYWSPEINEPQGYAIALDTPHKTAGAASVSEVVFGPKGFKATVTVEGKRGQVQLEQTRQIDNLVYNGETGTTYWITRKELQKNEPRFRRLLGDDIVDAFIGGTTDNKDAGVVDRMAPLLLGGDYRPAANRFQTELRPRAMGVDPETIINKKVVVGAETPATKTEPAPPTESAAGVYEAANKIAERAKKAVRDARDELQAITDIKQRAARVDDILAPFLNEYLKYSSEFPETRPVFDDLMDTRRLAVANKKVVAPKQAPPPAPKTVQQAVEQAPVVTAEGTVVEQPRQQKLFASPYDQEEFIKKNYAAGITVPSSTGAKIVDIDMGTTLGSEGPYVFLPKASGEYFRPKPVANVDDPVLKAALLDVVERLRAIKDEGSKGTKGPSAKGGKLLGEEVEVDSTTAELARAQLIEDNLLYARSEAARQQRLFGLAFGGATLASAMPADASPLMGVMPGAILSLPDIGHVVSNPGAAVAGIVGTAVAAGVLASLRKLKKAGGFGPWFRDYVTNSPEIKGYWNTLSSRVQRDVLSNTKSMWDRALSLVATPSRAIGGATAAATQFGLRELGEGLAEGLKLKDAAYNDFMAYFDKGLMNMFGRIKDLQVRPRAAAATRTIMDTLANNDSARKAIPELQALTSAGDLMLPLKLNEMVSKLRQGDKAARQMYNNFGAYLDARYPTPRDQESLWEFFSRREQDLTPTDRRRFAEFLADDNLRIIRRAIDELADLTVQNSGLSAGAANEYRGRYIRTFGLRGRDKADLIGRLADMLSFSERRGSAFAGGQKGEYRGITKSNFASDAARDAFVADRNTGWVVTSRFTRKSGNEDVAFARLEDINGNIREIEEADLPNWNTEGYAKWRRFTDDDGTAKAIRDLTLPELKTDGYKIDLTAAARNTLMSLSKQKTRNMLAASIAADPDLALSGRTADDMNQSWSLRRWGQNPTLGVFEWTGNRVGDQFEVVSVGSGQRALVDAKKDANGNVVGFVGEFARSKDNNFAASSNFAPAVLFDGKRWEVIRVAEKNGKVVYDIRRDGNTVKNVDAEKVRKFRMLTVPERVRTSGRGIGAFLPGEFNYGQLNDTFVSPDVYATMQGLVKGSLLKRGVDVFDSTVFGNRLWKMGVVGQNLRSAVTQTASNIVAASEVGVGISEMPYAAKKVLTDKAEMQRLEAAGLFADLGSTQQTGVTRLTNQADFQKWTANDAFKRMSRQFLAIPEDERTIGDYLSLVWNGVVAPRGGAAFRAIPGIIQFQDQVARYAIYDRFLQNNMANGMNESAASVKAVEDTLAVVFRTDTHPLVTVASKTVMPWANVIKYSALTAPVVAAANPFNYFQTKLQMGVLGALVGAFNEDEPVEVTDFAGNVKKYTSAQIRRMVADKLRPELARNRYTWTGVPKDVRLNIPGIGTVVLNTEKFDPASNEYWSDFGGRPAALIDTMSKVPALLRGDKGSLRDVLTAFAAHRGYLPPVTDETPLREEVRDGMKAMLGAFAPMGISAGRVVSPTRAQQDRATAALMFLVSATKYNPSETLRQIDGYTFGETEALRQSKNAAIAKTADEDEQMAIREEYDKRIDAVNRAAAESKVLINALVAQDEKQGLVPAGTK